jgi:hypothetical protein
MGNEKSAGTEILEAVAKGILEQVGPDEEAYRKKAAELLADLRTRSAAEGTMSGSGASGLFSFLGDNPTHVGMELLMHARKQHLAAQVQTDVPIVSAVFTMSLIWATGHRLDNIIVPNATAEQSSLTFAQLTREVAHAITNVLYGIYEQGVEEVRKNDAYLMDAPRFERLMDVLQEFVDKQNDEERSKYAAIMDRMRMLMQVMTEADLKVS